MDHVNMDIFILLFSLLMAIYKRYIQHCFSTMTRIQAYQWNYRICRMLLKTSILSNNKIKCMCEQPLTSLDLDSKLRSPEENCFMISICAEVINIVEGILTYIMLSYQDSKLYLEMNQIPDVFFLFLAPQIVTYLLLIKRNAS